MSGAAFIKAVDNQLYITGNNGFYNLDQSMNFINTYAYSSATYRGLYCNQTNRRFYAVSPTLNRIDIFDFNLKLLRSLTNSYTSNGLNGNLISIYAGTSTGNIVVYRNESYVYRSFTSVCTADVLSITIDASGFMYVSCNAPENLLKVFHVNGANTGITFVIINNVYVGVISKLRLFIISFNN